MPCSIIQTKKRTLQWGQQPLEEKVNLTSRSREEFLETASKRKKAEEDISPSIALKIVNKAVPPDKRIENITTSKNEMVQVCKLDDGSFSLSYRPSNGPVTEYNFDSKGVFEGYSRAGWTSNVIDDESRATAQRLLREVQSAKKISIE